MVQVSQSSVSTMHPNSRVFFKGDGSYSERLLTFKKYLSHSKAQQDILVDCIRSLHNQCMTSVPKADVLPSLLGMLNLVFH